MILLRASLHVTDRSDERQQHIGCFMHVVASKTSVSYHLVYSSLSLSCLPACLPVYDKHERVVVYCPRRGIHVVTKVVKSLSLVRLVRGTDVSDLFTQ